MNILQYIIDNQTTALAAIAAVGLIGTAIVKTGLDIYAHAKKSWLELDGGPDQESLRVIVGRIDQNTKDLTVKVTAVEAEQKAQGERLTALERAPESVPATH